MNKTISLESEQVNEIKSVSVTHPRVAEDGQSGATVASARY